MKKHDKIDVTEQLIEIEEDSDIDLDFVETLAKAPFSVSAKLKVQMDRVRKRLGQDFFPKVIWTIAQKSYEASEAKKLWDGIVRHKRNLDNKLGREVGISVAALDYMENIVNDLPEPKIVEAGDFKKIAESALVDELTGLYGRAVFDVSIDKNISEYKRYESHVSLIMAAIDGKEIAQPPRSNGWRRI